MRYVEDSENLRIFIAYSSNDRPAVGKLYQRLKEDGFSPWQDVDDILPGADWHLEIRKALRNSHIVLICLSPRATTKAGYFQKEIKYALDIAEEQPEGAIFVIPVKLEECEVPESLKRWQWVDIFKENAYNRLRLALKIRAEYLGIKPLLPVKYRVRSGDPLEGEYRVTGTNDEGMTYHGTATIRVRDGVFYVISRIGPNVHICQGFRSGHSLRVRGDFRVHYKIKEDGSLEGKWGEIGTEKLIPR